MGERQEKIVHLGARMHKIGVTDHPNKKCVTLKLCDGFRPELLEVPYGQRLGSFMELIRLALEVARERSRFAAALDHLSRLGRKHTVSVAYRQGDETARAKKELARGNVVRTQVANAISCEVSVTGHIAMLAFHNKGNTSARDCVKLSANIGGLEALLKALHVSP